MERIMTVKIDSTLERQLDTVRLSPSERQVALSALHTANTIVDAAEWCVKKIEQFGVPTFLKPSLKH